MSFYFYGVIVNVNLLAFARISIGLDVKKNGMANGTATIHRQRIACFKTYNVFHLRLPFLLLLSRSWIKSYLLNLSFYVNIEHFKSFVFLLQGFVLGPLLFILIYTTPLTTVMSYSAANHHLYHLYADDTRILKFSALDFFHNISLTLNTLLNSRIAHPTGCVAISFLFKSF